MVAVLFTTVVGVGGGVGGGGGWSFESDRRVGYGGGGIDGASVTNLSLRLLNLAIMPAILMVVEVVGRQW